MLALGPVHLSEQVVFAREKVLALKVQVAVRLPASAGDIFTARGSQNEAAVAVFVFGVSREAPLVLLGDRERNTALLFDDHMLHEPSRAVLGDLTEAVLSEIVHFADLNPLEVGNEVLVVHPERAVVIALMLMT